MQEFGQGSSDMPFNESLRGDHDTSLEPLTMTANNAVNQVGNIMPPSRSSGKKNLSVREAKNLADKSVANETR